MIKAVVSKKKLTLIPDISPDSLEVAAAKDNEFEVIVINETNKFASFQLELLTSGSDPNSTVKWYKVEPEVCAKKPPGSRTNFHVVITKAPIPIYDTTIELTLRVFSVEFSNLFVAQTLSLTIERPRRSLRVYLPIKDLKGYPGDSIEIPVIVYNLSSRFTEVALRFLDLNSSWLLEETERRVPIAPGESEKVNFWCQPPKNPKIISQKYNFTIEAKSETSRYSTREEGSLEVLPQGVVEFSCTPKKQRIPRLRRGLLSKQFKSATYELKFENNSNLPQQVSVQVSEQDQEQCCLVIPESVNLDPGETKYVHLVAKKPRPWWGRKQRLLFEVAAVLSNPNSNDSPYGDSVPEGNGFPERDSFASRLADPTNITTATRSRNTQIHPNPSIQILELEVVPIIPLWLQIVGVLITLVLLWLLWLLNSVEHHNGPVNSVRFSGDATTVISGSSDQTIRRWLVDTSSPWELNGNRLKPDGLIAKETKKAVRVVRHIPENNDLVAAGLENGEIQLWNVKLRTKAQKTFDHPRGDRVFGLEFTRDSRYLFSGHSSGSVRQWDMKSTGNQLSPVRVFNVPFTISALALSESPDRGSLIVIGGRYNKLALWDWAMDNQPYYVSYQLRENPDKFSPVIGKHHYIESLTTAGNLLATADNQGYITLWDISDRTCSIKNSFEKAAGRNSNVENTASNNRGNRFERGECEIPILDQWHDGHSGKPVRSVALTDNGCYLVSTGDDGRVMLWSLTGGQRTLKQGKIIAQFPGVRLNAVDLTRLGNDIYVTSDGKNNQVKVYRVKGTDANASCQ